MDKSFCQHKKCCQHVLAKLRHEKDLPTHFLGVGKTIFSYSKSIQMIKQVCADDSRGTHI